MPASRPAVRQRTLQALAALHLPASTGDQTQTIGSGSFPLSMNKLVKLLAAEQDPSVLAVLLRVVRRVISVRRLLRVHETKLIAVRLARNRRMDKERGRIFSKRS